MSKESLINNKNMGALNIKAEDTLANVICIQSDFHSRIISGHMV